MKRLKTLRVRFALWTAGLLLAALALFGVFVYANMSRSLVLAIDETLQLTAIDLAGEVELEKGEPAFVENPTEDTPYFRLREQGFSLRILSLAGNAIQAYGPYRELPQPSSDFVLSNSVGEFTTTTDPVSQDPVRVYTVSVTKGDRVVGVLQVALNLKNVRHTLDLLLATLLIAGPLIVIVAGGGGYFIAAQALASIDKITRTARNISANQLSARLNLPETDDEVGRLVGTFDSMLARLDDAFRRERQFTADASHELRTPLSAIQTIIGSTLARQRDAAEYEQALLDLGNEVERMSALTDGLLDLARHDAARQPAKFDRVDLSLVLKDVVDSFLPLAEEKGLRLIDAVPDHGLILMGDRDGLIRLFVNLIDNAIRYTNQGSITLSAQPKEDRGLTVTVSDTGIGIPAEHLLRVFDRFYRVDGSRSKNGTGLGLAIARNIARAHGGDITAESEVGQGSTFVVQLPAA